MRYPNLRYGNPTEMAYYAAGRDLRDLARMLRRDERTVRDWLSGRARVPWWVPEILRLKRIEADDQHRQMFGQPLRRGLAIVTDSAQLELRRPRERIPLPLTALRLDDFDQQTA